MIDKPELTPALRAGASEKLSRPTDPSTPLGMRLNFKNGFNFGLGFWLASAVFFMVILPVLGCVSLVTLSMFGTAITELFAR